MRVFFSYSHKDEQLRDQLDTHCAMLRRNGEIQSWHDRRILGGEAFDDKIRFELEHANIILLLISHHFLNSEYCYSVEMSRAIERSMAGSAHVLPVIAEVCDWQNSPVGKLMAVPRDGKPLSKYPNINDGFLEVVQEIRRIVKSKSPAQLPVSVSPRIDGTVESPLTRSSNLSLRKQFTTADRDRFLFASFEYMTVFFESSLKELEARNTGIETVFRKLNANAFTCQVYRNGALASKCQISVNALLGRTHYIYFSHELRDNTFNESLSAEANGQILYLKPSLNPFKNQGQTNALSQEGASEYYWAMLIEKLQ